ncbi:hypothetical protein [Nonomuraea jabiensis]|uniref:hypothetical protein n=1 Tax=Nonomuraea jabiensis TaxID=882448 RepID=UPI003D722D2A
MGYGCAGLTDVRARLTPTRAATLADGEAGNSGEISTVDGAKKGNPMIAGNLIRRALAVGAMLATTVAMVVTTQQPAAASTLTLNATVDCLNVNYSGDTSDWYASYVSVGSAPPSYGVTMPYSSMVANPANHTWSFTISLPGGSTSVSVSAICSGGHQYDQVGWTNGPAISIPSSATTLTATWGCSTQQVYPGPYITGCSAQSYSYS